MSWTMRMRRSGSRAKKTMISRKSQTVTLDISCTCTQKKLLLSVTQSLGTSHGRVVRPGQVKVYKVRQINYAWSG